MEFQVNNENYVVKIVRKRNKNTYVRVKENHVILVTTGPFTTRSQIKKLLQCNQENLENMARRCRRDEENNNKVYFFGKMYDIMIVADNKNVTVCDNCISTPSLTKLDSWYKKKVLEIFEKRLDNLYYVFEEDIPYPKVKVRKMKTRWGVCNKRDCSVTLNLNLMRYSSEKLDYVIIHELCHFVHFDHSSSFWNLVRKYCPDYKRIRKELRD